MLVIGLGHKARQGKGEFVQAVLRANKGGRFGVVKPLSFATALREEVAECALRLWDERHAGSGVEFDGHEAMRLVCISFSVEFDDSPIFDKLYPWGKQRKLLQWWGTEYRRTQDPEYWIKEARRRAIASGASVVIFDDMRFPNEYDMVGDMGGVRIKVSRLGYKSDVPEHISETALDDYPFDVRIAVRNGLLPLLKSTAVHIVGELTSQTK
jgi:hypothetical protein